jgi:uncharacterized MAPEG superfamily protein
MPGKVPQPELIRVVVIVVLIAASLLVRMAKKSAPAKKTASPPTVLDALRQASAQARARRQQPFEADPQLSASPQPMAIRSESSFLPSLLLIALLVCLALMAYRFFAG